MITALATPNTAALTVITSTTILTATDVTVVCHSRYSWHKHGSFYGHSHYCLIWLTRADSMVYMAYRAWVSQRSACIVLVVG